jgi:hypothetical protein
MPFEHFKQKLSGMDLITTIHGPGYFNSDLKNSILIEIK